MHQKFFPVAVFIVSVTVLFARRPEILLSAQFWAEDGTIWYLDAFNEGWWAPLLKPHTGYFQTFSRLVFGALQFVPLEAAPAVANVIGLVFRALPAAFLFSSRFGWIDHRAKLALLLYYLLMPGLAEVHANITNTHWYLAIYMLMIAIANRPSTPAWRIHDYAALILAGLSGPFVIFAVPCFLLRDIRERKLSGTTGLAIALAALQAASIAMTFDTRAVIARPLGASPLLLAQILTTRVFAGFGVPASLARSLQAPLIAVPIAVAGVVMVLHAIRNGGWRIHSVLIFAGLLLAAALLSPAVNANEHLWPVLLGGGDRYFVVPSLIWFALLVWAASGMKWTRRGIAVALVAIPVILIINFRIWPVPEFHFQQQVAAYRAAAPGEAVVFNIPPGWAFELVRR